MILRKNIPKIGDGNGEGKLFGTLEDHLRFVKLFHEARKVIIRKAPMVGLTRGRMIEKKIVSLCIGK